MLIIALLNCEDYIYYGTLELNNTHQRFAKLHRILMWNSRMKECSSKVCLNCIDFYRGTQELNSAYQRFAKLRKLLLCGTQELNYAHQNFPKLHRLLMWNSRMKQCSSKLCLNCIDFYCGTQK